MIEDFLFGQHTIVPIIIGLIFAPIGYYAGEFCTNDKRKAIIVAIIAFAIGFYLVWADIQNGVNFT